MIRTTLVLYFALYTTAALAWDATPVAIPHSGTIGPAWSSPKISDEYKQVAPDTSEIVTDLGEFRRLLHQYDAQIFDFTYTSATAVGMVTDIKFLGEVMGLNWLSKTGITIEPEVLKSIARFCETHYASTMDRISCAAYNTDKFLKNPGFYYVQSLRDGDNVDCRTENFMFQSVLKETKFANNDRVYPRSRLMVFKNQDGSVEPHVVTLVTIMDGSLRQLTYAVDAGFLPLSFYPYGQFTESLFSRP